MHKVINACRINKTRKSVHRTRMPPPNAIQKKGLYVTVKVYHQVTIKVDVIFKRTQLNLGVVGWCDGAG